MADIKRRFGLHHLRSAPTAHIRHHKRGALAHDGTGLSFWFRALSAALSEVPVDDRELAVTFHARTADFQDVAVQASVTYRISDLARRRPARLLARPRHRRLARHSPWSNSPPCSRRRRSSTHWTSWRAPRSRRPSPTA